MDKIVSTRLDETTVRRIGLLAQKLRTSKKAVIEAAILRLSEAVASAAESDVFAQTHGAWKRTESPRTTVARARKAFRDSLRRRQA